VRSNILIFSYLPYSYFHYHNIICFIPFILKSSRIIDAGGNFFGITLSNVADNESKEDNDYIECTSIHSSSFLVNISLNKCGWMSLPPSNQIVSYLPSLFMWMHYDGGDIDM